MAQPKQEVTLADIRKLEDALLRIETAVMKIELAMKPAKTESKQPAPLPLPGDRLSALEIKLDKLLSWMPGLANSR